MGIVGNRHMTTPLFAVRFPIRTVSELNLRGREHWSKRSKRVSEQRWLVTLILGLRKKELVLPLTVRFTRLAPRALDVGDNLNSSVKSVRDQVADWLGVNDNDPRVRWEYEQRKAKDYGVLMEVFGS